jgi:riboflavin synthase
MFTGIIETTGRVREVRVLASGKRLLINAGELKLPTGLGASIAINGCCTTIVESHDDVFHVELMPITLERTNLGSLKPGDRVDLERPLRMGDELGGHLVQGHIEGIGEVQEVTPDGENWLLRIRVPADLSRYIIKTGSIAIDGISLTVAEIVDTEIIIGIIPHTWAVTVVSDYRCGSRVNIETDMFAKYVENIMTALSARPAPREKNQEY